jgi:beta-galactosidase
MKRIVLILATALLVSCGQREKEVYLFSYFEGNGDGLHFASSTDGLNWQAVGDRKIFLKPEVGDSLMRDPSIVQDQKGVFHLVWTTGWRDQGIGYSSSTDLVNWSPQRFLPVMEGFEGTLNTWAPELYYDEADSLFYIIWASTVPGMFAENAVIESESGLNHRQFYVTTNDFQTFSDTQLFFDPGFSVIDGAIVKKEGRYWFIIKNEESQPAEKNLRVTFADDLKEGFPTEVSANISGESWAEGPSPIVLRDSVYVYFDKYRERKYGAIRSKDGVRWDDVSEQVTFPRGIRHGTAFAVKESVLARLLENAQP